MFFKPKKEDKSLTISDVIEKYGKDYHLNFDFSEKGYIKSIWVGSKREN